MNEPVNLPRCSTPENPWCTKRAVTGWICRVEGKEVRMCGPCDAAWKQRAKGDPFLSARCPNCTKGKESPALPRPIPLPMTVDMLGSYTEAAFRAAMRRSGVLSNQVEATIKLLKTDMSVWVESEVPVAQAGAADASG